MATQVTTTFSRDEEHRLEYLRNHLRGSSLDESEKAELDALERKYDRFIDEGLQTLHRLAGSKENTMKGMQQKARSRARRLCSSVGSFCSSMSPKHVVSFVIVAQFLLLIFSDESNVSRLGVGMEGMLHGVILVLGVIAAGVRLTSLLSPFTGWAKSALLPILGILVLLGCVWNGIKMFEALSFLGVYRLFLLSFCELSMLVGLFSLYNTTTLGSTASTAEVVEV